MYKRQPLSQLLKSSPGESKLELQLLLNVVTESLCGFDTAGNVTFCNDALLKTNYEIAWASRPFSSWIEPRFRDRQMRDPIMSLRTNKSFLEADGDPHG